MFALCKWFWKRIILGGKPHKHSGVWTRKLVNRTIHGTSTDRRCRITVQEERTCTSCGEVDLREVVVLDNAYYYDYQIHGSDKVYRDLQAEIESTRFKNLVALNACRYTELVDVIKDVGFDVSDGAKTHEPTQGTCNRRQEMNSRSKDSGKFSAAKQRAMRTPSHTTTFRELAGNTADEVAAHSDNDIVQSNYWPGYRKSVPSALQKFKLPKDQSEYFIKLPPQIELKPEKVRRDYVKFWKEAKYNELMQVLETTGFDVSDPDTVQDLLVRFITGH